MGPRGGVVTQRSAKPCTPVQFRSWPPAPAFQISDFFASYINGLPRSVEKSRNPACHPKSAGCIPALGKRKQRPSQLVVVRGQRGGIEHQRQILECRARVRRNRKPDGIQQPVEFNFAHGWSPCQEPPWQKAFVRRLK